MGYINNSQQFNHHDIGNIIPDHTLIKTTQQDIDLEEIRLQKQLNLFKQMQANKKDVIDIEDVTDEEEENYTLSFEKGKMTLKEKIEVDVKEDHNELSK